jgi:transglutaminase-like putative cysteine protease
MPIGGQFAEIAKEAINGKENDSKLIQARALYDYIIDNMRYMKFGDYGRGDAVYACDSKTGNCTEFHSFFISLARSIGIPARFSIGASIPSERNEGGLTDITAGQNFMRKGNGGLLISVKEINTRPWQLIILEDTQPIVLNSARAVI